MDVFTAASHHDILVLLFQVALLLFAARALGEVSQRLGQPAVVGEILAGIVLGPSLLSGLFPVLGEWLVPQTPVQGYLLETVALLGAMFLLLITGLETDLALIRRHARTAIGVSLGGIITTFSSGFLLGQLLPDFLLADPDRRLVFALFVGTAMAISAIPVIAKVMMDMNLMRRDIGQTIIAAGMSDDTIGWIMLSVVAGLAAGAAVTVGSVLQAIGSVLAFLLISFTLGRWLVKKVLAFVQDGVMSRDRLLTLVVVLTFLFGAITQALNLEAVLGAFVLGILVGNMPRLPQEVQHKLESVALAIFAPVFFAVAGLKVDLWALLEPTLLLITLLVIAIATVGKVTGTYLGARLIGRRNHWTALSFGAGLNARGAMEIIIATIGLRLGILSQEMFSIIVIMAMATSLMAPFALRFVLKRVQPEEQELLRLKQEELAVGSLIANMRRVLVPVRQRTESENRAIQTIEAHVLERMKAHLSITLLTVVKPGERGQANDFLMRLTKLFPQKDVTKKVVEADSPANIILDEAHKDYDLILLGASDRGSSEEVVFNPIVDYLIRVSPCPTMVVKGRRFEEHWPPKRILIPTNGSIAARHAAEVGFLLARKGEQVTILNVITRSDSGHLDASGRGYERQLSSAHGIVHELVAFGEALGVHTESEIRDGRDPESVILDLASKQNFDLIILGTDLRAGSERLFLGPRVERILENAPCPVIVFNAL
jgi:Kef-type K+ transport system membrane component KefB/nucleotide-binding universal stress UspA family protein